MIQDAASLDFFKLNFVSDLLKKLFSSFSPGLFSLVSFPSNSAISTVCGRLSELAALDLDVDIHEKARDGVSVAAVLGVLGTGEVGEKTLPCFVSVGGASVGEASSSTPRPPSSSTGERSVSPSTSCAPSGLAGSSAGGAAESISGTLDALEMELRGPSAF